MSALSILNFCRNCETENEWIQSKSAGTVLTLTVSVSFQYAGGTHKATSFSFGRRQDTTEGIAAK